MYSVPVIPPDLRHEETIIQAANALNCLQTTITNIFDRIDKRISKNNDKINELSSRITSASQSIQSLSDTKKAIKIFSPAKFPSSHVFRNIELTFNDGKTTIDPSTHVNYLNDHEITSRVDLGPTNIQEKLVFFHFRGAKNKSTGSASVTNQRGLGDIPANSKSINSVLLFSTSKNVYGARKAMDDMSSNQPDDNKGAKKAEVGTSSGLIIEPAPLSLSNRQKGANKRQQGLFYTPKLNEAPTIDLPADLPDLPGIAGDIQFVQAADTHQIAPSLFFDQLDLMPEVPTATENTSESEIAVLSSPNALEPINPVEVSTNRPSIQPPPPPPPPPPVLPEITPVAPPPPPPAPLTEASSVITPPPPTEGTALDARANLMDAIRRAGGARGGRLRAAADVARQTSTEQLNDVPVKPKLVSGSGSDLMADLHNKLLMRRKGISGAKNGQGNPVGSGCSVMSRLSDLIPPPPVKGQNSSSDDDGTGDDADWAD